MMQNKDGAKRQHFDTTLSRLDRVVAFYNDICQESDVRKLDKLAKHIHKALSLSNKEATEVIAELDSLSGLPTDAISINLSIEELESSREQLKLTLQQERGRCEQNKSLCEGLCELVHIKTELCKTTQEISDIKSTFTALNTLTLLAKAEFFMRQPEFILGAHARLAFLEGQLIRIKKDFDATEEKIVKQMHMVATNAISATCNMKDELKKISNDQSDDQDLNPTMRS